MIAIGIGWHALAFDNGVVIIGLCWLTNILFDWGCYLHLPREKREMASETAGKIVSVCHTMLTVPVAVGYLWGIISLETWLQAQQITMGYLIYDAMYLLIFARMFNKSNDVPMLIHHISFYLGINLLPLSYQRPIALAYLAEISNPFLYWSWYMYKSGIHLVYPRFFKATALSLIATFFVFRICNFSNLVFEVAHTSWVGAILGSALWTLNMVWFYKLVKKFKEASDRQSIVKKTE